ncbi:MAG: DUF1007 family protein [Smithellaceae bacterium]
MWKKFSITMTMGWFLAACLLSAAAKPALAHPHVFIDTSITVEFNDHGLSGFKVEWVFDTMFGSRLIADYDHDKNGRLDMAESAEIEQKAFSNVSKFNYFTYVYIGSKRHDIVTISHFQASILGKTLQYAFFIPFERAWNEIDGNIWIGFFDKTNFCDFQFNAEKPFSVSSPQDIDIVAKIVSTRDGWVRHRAFEELRIQYKKTQ